MTHIRSKTEVFINNRQVYKIDLVYDKLKNTQKISLLNRDIKIEISEIHEKYPACTAKSVKEDIRLTGQFCRKSV